VRCSSARRCTGCCSATGTSSSAGSARSTWIRSSYIYIAGGGRGAGAVALSARNPAPDITTVASPLLAIEGFSLLLGAGLVFGLRDHRGFVWKLAQEGGRSIQAATGMFYLAVIMAFSAELAAKFRFFAAG
jgi:hypothetical protein